ncbi:TIGR04282 family arsenosugar biosynthesis glycosyltransferase [uncultured Alcanivorax sp.]|uniref:TIGR04282 family arsenosugar biosynthesis glycosyltransferase n=1 Tax=Alcanivorax sp. IL2 TaxID=3396310 RepID=UPI00262033DE|nr:TIGR04282 family arsenosugar biosynthesis glycosyltransferase [uncultured Alcanivorax sp.]
MASTERASQPLLIVFARALQAGRVKTRLIPDFGEEGALTLYRLLLTRTIAAACDFPGQVQLWLDQADAELQALAERNGWSCHLQQGEDLGEKMAQALSRGLAQADQVLLVGSDCAVLDQDYFEQALQALDKAPVVFGPSEDGGYVLIGSSSQALWHPQRFRGVRFGGEQALADSVACFPAERVVRLPVLWDVDTRDDVERAQSCGLLPMLQGVE